MSQNSCSSGSCSSGGCASHDAERRRGHHPGASQKVSSQSISKFIDLGPQILRAALWPFVLAFALVYTGRSIGAPICFAISPWHFLAVVAFGTAVMRLAEGPAFVNKGRTMFGLAVPKPNWPGTPVALSIVGSALAVSLPIGGVLLGLVLIVKEAVWALDVLALKVVVLMIPEFVLTALLGLVIGVTFSRLRQESALKEIQSAKTAA